MPTPRTVVLLALLLATLVMPVSYRAGADHAHAHTIFQGLIDALVGHHHHHGDTEHESHGNASQADALPSAPAGIPLTMHLAPGELDTQGFGAAPEIDPPDQLGLSRPISAFADIQSLGLLLAALLAGVTDRPLWGEARRLLTRAVSVEIPPPRLMS